MEGWKPLATQARIAQVAEPNARRYVSAFPQFFPARKLGKALVYGPDTVEILKVIADAFAQKKVRGEVEEILAVQFTRTHDVEPIPKDTPPPPTPDRTSPPALPEVMTALIPLAERFLTAYEAQTKALQDIARALASNRAQDAPKASGDTNPHPDHETGQESPLVDVVVNRDAVIAEVHRLRGLGLGQHAIMTRVRREGLRMSARGEISKSTVARIIKGDIKS